MKYVVVLSVFLLSTCVLKAQIVKNNSIVWYPYSLDARVSFTFYAKGVMAGSVEPAELLIKNNTNNKLLVKVTYYISDLCSGGTKEYTKAVTLMAQELSSSYGAFFSGIDYSTNCKEERKFADNLKTKISDVRITINLIEDITAKEEERKRKQDEEEERKKQEELKKKKEQEAAEAKRQKEIALKEQQEKERLEKIKSEQEEEKIKKDFEQKEAAAKALENETERKEALEKLEKEKTENNKKVSTAAKKTKVYSELSEKEKDSAYQTSLYINKLNQAAFLEKEGDKFFAMGGVFLDFALAKYEEAQKIIYSYSVQVKIDKINNTKQAAKLVNEGLDKMEDAAAKVRDDLDNAGIPKLRASGFWYEGFSPTYKNFVSIKKISPKIISFTYGFYRILALEAGFTYYQSPVHSFGIEDNNGKYTGQNIDATYTAFGPDVAIGLAFPAKYFDIYAVYGFYFPFVLSATPYSDKYKYEDFKDNFGVTTPISRLKFGSHIKIPKTRIGIAVQYSLNSINGEKLLTGGTENITDQNNQKFGLGPGKASATDRLKYNVFGVSFFIKGL